MGLSLLLGLARRHARNSDWNGRKSDNHERQREPTQHDSEHSEGHTVIGRRRMARAGEEQERHHHHIAKLAANNHKGDGAGEQQERESMRPAANERVQNVAAVELPDRHQVQCGDEDSHPTSEQPGVQDDVVILRDSSKVKLRKPLEEQGVAIARVRHRGVDIGDMRLGEANQRDWDRKDETRQRSADRNIKQALAIRHTRPLNDDSSHRSPRHDGQWNEEGQRRRHLVTPGLQIVPHFMGEKSRHHRAEENEPVLEHFGQELWELPDHVRLV
ncbi:MAG TPA: hypothetical protein VG055_28885 [Planctomycetaceae bacterium]|nr:hypothetical protein [Planctomycetaceae bacterium]